MTNSFNCLKILNNFFVRFFLTFLLVPAFYFISNAQANVIMNHNDLKRTGWNGHETILTQKNISHGNFGLVFARNVDDQIYAQPLVLSNVSIGGGKHNIVIVATVNNTLYAFDADQKSVANPYWERNLTFNPVSYRPVKNTDMAGACGGNYKDFSGNIGIVGTPAIDAGNNTLYVVSRSIAKTGTLVFVQYLHAIDITTGAEKKGSPVTIKATIAGTGQGSAGGIMSFDPQKQNQRPGLLLYKGIVYIAWASHCDWGPYQGWLIGYDASTLQQKYVYNTETKNGGGLGGIWMSGQPPSVDDNGNIYITTGNGTTGSGGNDNDTLNRGSSLIKLSGSLRVTDFFTPMNFKYLNDHDLDYGIDGALLIPGTHLSLSGSKEGRMFLINNEKMGGATRDNSNVLQILNVSNSNISNTRHLHGSPVYFKDTYNHEYVYAWAEGSLLKQFPFNRSKMLFDTLNKKSGITVLPNGMPGAMLSGSSNGNDNSTAILWASHPIHGNANQAVVPGMLQAFDANDVTHELWNSNWNSKRDSIGKFAKFVPPTIANGKVYMATFSNKLNVYGLNPLPVSECAASLPPSWQSSDIGYVLHPGDVCVQDGVYSISASGDDIWNAADAFHYLYQPANSDGTELTARVLSIKNTNANAKCGIMFRQNLDPGSPYVFLTITPNKLIWLQQRDAQSASAKNVKSLWGYSAPYWLRVTKRGNKYVGYISNDGSDWDPVDSVTLALGSNPYVGVAYTTCVNSLADTAQVDNLTLKSDISADNIVNFSAKNIDEKFALLNWAATVENNIDHFDIERSSVNSDFEKIGTIAGNGSATTSHDYSFNDLEPLSGANFYRLKEVDKHGYITYTPVVAVQFNFKKIKIYPNPASNRVYILNNRNFSSGDNLKIQLIDFSGRVLYQQTSPSTEANIIAVNIPSKIADGVYVVLVSNSKGEKQGDKIFISRR